MLDLLLIIRSCVESVGRRWEVQEIRKTSGLIESFVLGSVLAVLMPNGQAIILTSWTSRSDVRPSTSHQVMH